MARGFNYAPGASAEVAEAQQPGLHKTHLMALGQSTNKLVREAIAGRDDCPFGLMVTFAHDHVPEVRIAVARNPKALLSVMEYLAADRQVKVVEALLENPSLPSAVIEELAFHKKGPVRAAAAARLDAGMTNDAVVPEDIATPELRDRGMDPVEVFGPTGVAPHTQDFGTVVDIATGTPVVGAPVGASPGTPVPTLAPDGADHAATEPAPVPAPERVAPTRTAPVRGFRPPQTG